MSQYFVDSSQSMTRVFSQAYAAGTLLSAGAFPSSPTDGMLCYRTDFRALFQYVAARLNWEQVSIGTFEAGDGFPANPITNLRVWRADSRCQYTYNGSAWQIDGVEGVYRAVVTPSQSVGTTNTTINGTAATFTALGAGRVSISALVAFTGIGVNLNVFAALDGTFGAVTGQATGNLVTIVLIDSFLVSAGTHTVDIRARAGSGSVVIDAVSAVYTVSK